MKITWIGHACFKVESKGYSVVFDPSIDGMVPGLKPIREEANMVICSHEHDDHNATQNITITDGGEPPFKVTQLDTFHDPEGGKLRGPNKITIIDDGETRLAHFGDLGVRPTDDQMDELKGLDIALVPVGGHFTIDGREAAEIVKELTPRIVIPMHFRDPAKGFGFDVIGPVDDFATAMGGAEYMETSVLDLSEVQIDDGISVKVLVPKNL